MKAVLLVGGFSTQMRPLTLTHPLPLLEFCNEPLIKMQLQVLKEAGATHAIVCYYERHVPSSWAESVARLETELGIKITCCKEEVAGGTAGAIKIAEEYITDAGTSDAPFFVVNSDVLCMYPLRDLLHQHIRNGREGTVLTTRTTTPSQYGVVVADERTGRITHFVEKPETFISDLINAGVYVFSPSIFGRIPDDPHTSMNGILKTMAYEEQLHSMLLSGYWVKLVDPASYLSGVAAHLEITRFMNPGALTSACEAYEVRGDVMVHKSAVVGAGSVLGPRVVIGPDCEVGEGVRLEGAALLRGSRVQAHSLIKDSVIGWGSDIGKWCSVCGSVFGEAVRVRDNLLVNRATVLPQKEIYETIRSAQIVI